VTLYDPRLERFRCMKSRQSFSRLTRREACALHKRISRLRRFAPSENGWVENEGPGSRGAGFRGTGSRGVENAGSAGKRGVRWKTRGSVENAGSGGLTTRGLVENAGSGGKRGV